MRTKALWWIVGFISAWLGLLLLTDRRRFRLFASGGVWSLLIALILEALVRRHIDFFRPEHLLVPVFESELLLLLGPRFVEGVLFMQRVRPGSDATHIIRWTSAVLLSELMLGWATYISLTWSGFAVSAAVHALRFTALLGIFYAFNYLRKKDQLDLQAQAEAQGKLALRASRYVWVVAWPIFWVGAGAFSGLFRFLTRNRST